MTHTEAPTSADAGDPARSAGLGQTCGVKRSTAIRHLVELAEAASDRLPLVATDFGWPLEELWVTGALLDPVDELEHGSVVLMIPPSRRAALARGPPNSRVDR